MLKLFLLNCLPGRSPDRLVGVRAGVAALLSEASPATVDPGLVQVHGAVEGGRGEDATVVHGRTGRRSWTVLG